MFAQRLFDSLSRLIFSRRVRDYEEHHGHCEDAYAARLGPLHLETNHCFVLEHDDASISIRIPLPVRSGQALPQAGRGRWLWGKLHLGYMVCLGEDEIRQPGFYRCWQKPLPEVTCGKTGSSDSSDDFPF